MHVLGFGSDFSCIRSTEQRCFITNGQPERHQREDQKMTASLFLFTYVRANEHTDNRRVSQRRHFARWTHNVVFQQHAGKHHPKKTTKV
jgi:hypothetical protein